MILLVNGPNLNMLGKRDPKQYGTFSLADVESAFTQKAKSLGFQARCFQSNIEGEIVSAIHAAREDCAGIVINAGAYTHTSYAILDALSLTDLPVMEVHISDIHAREPFRTVSVIQAACVGQVSGLGFDSYLVGLEKLVNEHIHNPSPAKSVKAEGLLALRNEITAIDAQFMRLFNRRMKVAEQVAASKAISGKAIFDGNREAEVCQTARDRVDEPFGNGAESVMRTIMRLSRERQYELLLEQLRSKTAISTLPESADGSLDFVKTVSFGGTIGSYSEKASQTLFPNAKHTATWSFADACASVLEGKTDAAVLPLANTTGGVVETVYKLLQQDLHIVRAFDLPITHCLAVIPETSLDSITHVMSHPQGLAQCSNAIRTHQWEMIAVENTAYAAKAVAEKNDSTLAAICSKDAAEQNGLIILPDTICDTPCNTTRFIAITRKLLVTPDAIRLGIVMTLPHKDGALSAALEVFSDYGLSLEAISSQPIPDQPWEYNFFIDICAPALDSRALAALCQLSSELPRLDIIGWYGTSS